MIWASNFLQYFFANFSEDVVVYLRDGMFTDAYDRDEFYINMSTMQQVQQPEGQLFMMVKFIRGSTEFATIGDRNNKHKREPFSFNCRILTPKGKSNKRAYQLEHELDKTFINFNPIATPDFVVRLNQRIPKESNELQDPLQKVYDELEINYRFIVDFC